jgi:hypothetical protein
MRRYDIYVDTRYTAHIKETVLVDVDIYNIYIYVQTLSLHV